MVPLKRDKIFKNKILVTRWKANPFNSLNSTEHDDMVLQISCIVVAKFVINFLFFCIFSLYQPYKLNTKDEMIERKQIERYWLNVHYMLFMVIISCVLCSMFEIKEKLLKFTMCLVASVIWAFRATSWASRGHNGVSDTIHLSSPVLKWLRTCMYSTLCQCTWQHS